MRVKTEARRETIISEAAQLFREQGYEGASMNVLSKRLGGSKATLYSYFESKESLFYAVTESLGQAHLDSALKELSESDGQELSQVLQRFGEVMIALINMPEALAMYRMVIGEAGRSDIGHIFYEIGPQRFIRGLGQVLKRAIEKETLRPCDPEIAARHLLALIKSESDDFIFQRTAPQLTRKQMKEMVSRAIEVFMGGYRR
jgi:AcrR family transcriptional regulator